MSFPRLSSVKSFFMPWAALLLVLTAALLGPTSVGGSAARRSSPLVADQAKTTPSGAGRSGSQRVSNPLNDLLDEAQRDIDKSDFQAAITPLEKFLAEKPDVAYGHFQLAYVYTALKRSDEARTEYERTIALDPKMPEAYLNLGMLLLDKQEYAAAVAPLRKAVDLLPAQSRPRYLLGVAQGRSGDQTGAVESFEAVLHLDPNDLAAIDYLGQAALRTNQPAEAEAKFRHSLQIAPRAPGALQGLAQSLEAQKKPEAAGAYRDYLAVQPDDSGARARLIHFLVDQQQYSDALAELDRADAGKPPSLASLKLRADIQIGQKKFDDAVNTLQRAIAIAPNDPQLLGGLGRIYMQKRDFASAEKELKAALQLDRNNLTYWKDLSSTYYLAGNCPATLAALDVIAKGETPAAASWFIRALCYDKLHQVRPALEAYQKFLDMDQGRNPDQVWQAQQRSKVLKRMLEEKR